MRIQPHRPTLPRLAGAALMLLLPLFPVLLRAQTAPARPAKPAPPVVLEHTFNQHVDDRVRIHLDSNTTYRLEVDDARARLRITPVSPGLEPPLVMPLLPGRGVSGTRLYTIQTRDAGEYEVRVTGGDPARPVPVTLSVAPSPLVKPKTTARAK
ncbi:MAG TPA: hypothetical protein VFS40_13585 [Gemmatimonadales bacterium]|nr:hypothetical protein [Gemmatimonadales bacterium]